MGVFLYVFFSWHVKRSLPHVRGGVSEISGYVSEYPQSSPRAWGCFLEGLQAPFSCTVFPTCVGVFPK